jgi:hypothetical protein
MRIGKLSFFFLKKGEVRFAVVVPPEGYDSTNSIEISEKPD